MNAKHHNERHGHSVGGVESRTYRIWCRMKARCSGEYSSNYKWYGGRGIRVCDRWQSFDNFLMDMGDAPPGCTLDRIDNDGNYEPGNCRWADMKMQNRNRRGNRLVSYSGETLCLAEWAERTGINPRTIWNRLNRGWSIERALTKNAMEKNDARC